VGFEVDLNEFGFVPKPIDYLSAMGTEHVKNAKSGFFVKDEARHWVSLPFNNCFLFKMIYYTLTTFIVISGYKEVLSGYTWTKKHRSAGIRGVTQWRNKAG
jgi:hypothetical protein